MRESIQLNIDESYDIPLVLLKSLTALDHGARGNTNNTTSEAEEPGRRRSKIPWIMFLFKIINIYIKK